MAHSLYIASNEARSGKSLISLALMDLLLKRVKSVGFFKPIIDRREGKKKDHHINLILEYFQIPLDYDQTYGLYWDEVNDLLAQGRRGKLLEIILEKYTFQNYLNLLILINKNVL